MSHPDSSGTVSNGVPSTIVVTMCPVCGYRPVMSGAGPFWKPKLAHGSWAARPCPGKPTPHTYVLKEASQDAA